MYAGPALSRCAIADWVWRKWVVTTAAVTVVDITDHAAPPEVFRVGLPVRHTIGARIVSALIIDVAL